MLMQSNDSLAGRVAELAATRRHSDALFQRVGVSQFYLRPIPQRHRIAFYVGHLEAFDANLLLRGGSSPRVLDSAATPENRLDRLFAAGIDPIGDALPQDTPSDWPAMDEIRRYVAGARARVDRQLARGGALGAADGSLPRMLDAAIEHRWMHVETLGYMLNRLAPEDATVIGTACERALPDDDMLPISAGTTTLGADRRARVFAWDNEYARQVCEVPAFDIDRCMVTNGQFLRFLQAGGYQQPRWWHPEDYAWVQRHAIRHPASWRQIAGRWQLRSLPQPIAFQCDWPVYVSHAEAHAYASWAGKQLPTEAQWQRAAYATPDGGERCYPWGDEPPDSSRGNFDCARWDPLPVDAHPTGASGFGVLGMLGNGWEWTATAFAPLPGFEPQAFYPGYSADFFDGRHFVLKGGCAHTARRLLRRSFRNWFQAHYPYPFAGFRCVRNP